MNRACMAVLILMSMAASMWAAEDPTQSLYVQKCASCHGKDGKGAPAMAKMFKLEMALFDLTDKATLDKKDEELIKITSKGLNKMPAYETKLKAEEIIALTTYFRSLAPSSKPK
ncbi:MAG: cytochrome c [Elusimicrobia bacterium]|nr:cytochrome c [Elusimicrobiota bacterium]